MHSLYSSRVSNRKLRAGFVAAIALLPTACGAVWAQSSTARVALPYDQAQVDKEIGNARFLGHQSPQTQVNLVVMLPLRNQDQLNSLLADLYNPSSPRFRHYLTPQQFADQFGVTQADYDAVIKYAQSSGLTVTHSSMDHTLIDIKGDTDSVENAFGVRVNRYLMPDGRVSFAAEGIPSVPSDIRSKITGITGFNNLNVRHHHHTTVDPVSRALRALSPKTGTGQLGGFSPHDITTAYNVPTGISGQGQTVAVYELDSYVHSDVNTFATTYGLPQPNLVDILVDKDDGTVQDPGAEVEVVLDIDMVQSIAPSLKAIEVYQALNQDPDGLDEWSLIADQDTASVVSTSWGLPEDVLTPSSTAGQPPVEAAAENQIFQQMQTQGQSIYDASGDDGAFDDQITPGKQTTPEVDDPGSDPLITAVGGTSLTIDPSTSDYTSEVAWDFSGGGVSTIWTKPAYQTGVVGSTAATPPTMREVPDVALNADPNTPYDIYLADEGGWIEVGGTSAAAPLWAGFTGLVNEQLANLGSAPLGFANPSIYTIGKSTTNYPLAFHDITTNEGTTGNGVLAFAAHKGYDDSTGWGTFNAANLLNLLAVPQNSITGTITGTVSDSSGPVKGATVTARFANGQVDTTATTDATGAYTLTLTAGITFLISATYTVPITNVVEAGPSYTLTIPITNGQAQNLTQSFTLVASHTFPAGLQMISVPYEYTGIADFATVMGLAHDPPIAGVDALLFAYQTSSFGYVSTPAYPADTFHLGVGYWTDLNSVSQTQPTVGGSLLMLGTPAPTTQPFQIVLTKGWNMIGDPFTANAAASTFTVANTDGSDPVGIAHSADLNPASSGTSTIFYTYDPNATATGLYDDITASGTLNVYTGYWVFAYQNCILSIPAP